MGPGARGVRGLSLRPVLLRMLLLLLRLLRLRDGVGGHARVSLMAGVLLGRLLLLVLVTGVRLLRLLVLLLFLISEVLLLWRWLLSLLVLPLLMAGVLLLGGLLLFLLIVEAYCWGGWGRPGCCWGVPWAWAFCAGTPGPGAAAPYG